jgi:uncharacterized protein DUF5681
MARKPPTSGGKPPSSPGADGRSTGSDYLVGYGRPPKHTRFKPGRSGNPKGRPKRHRNLRTIVEDILSERIRIREGERTRDMPRIEALCARSRPGPSRATHGPSTPSWP